MSESHTVLKPKKLQKGQTLGLIAPASNVDDNETILAAVETLESLGFKVKQSQHLYSRLGYLAGSDQERAQDINGMFADPIVDGIVALGGGYGSSRILPYLNYDLIRHHPKVLMGYSDITALLNAIHAKTGLVTFHGPDATSTFTSYTLKDFRKVVCSEESNMFIGAPPEFEGGEGRVERKNRVKRIGSGKVRGRLIGGNLSLMSTLVGTPYAPDYNGKILILEDIGEATYRLDRLFTHLWLAGCLEKLAGIAFGKFINCNTTASWAKQQTVAEILVERCQALGIPALLGLMIGHVDDQTTVPLGCEAELDLDAATLRLLEQGVS